MPLPPITRFSSLATDPSQTNNNNGLYTPQLTDVQITAIPTKTKRNGGIWYNNTLNQLEAQVNGNTIPLGAGNGNVSGPANSTNNNIAVFDGTTGKVIKDSGVGINQVPGPPPLLRSSIDTLTPNAFVNEISNIGHIKFINDVSSIYVDTLTSIRFFPYDDQICSVFTSEIGAGGSSTSQSALLEINSDSGVLLLSRLTDQEQTALAAPLVAGMMFYNKTSNVFKCRDNSGWRTMPLYNTNGTLDVATPISSTNATTKAYVDTSISAIGAAKFIIQTANGLLPNAQALGSLTTGLLKNTTTTGVLSIATPGTDYYSPGFPTTIIESGLNFFIGTGTGNISGSGTNNTGVGTQVLPSFNTGTQNSSFGYQSSQNNIAGNNTCAFGFRSLRINTADQNSAFGSEALENNTSGTNNCSFGYQSSISNSVGSSNCAFGMGALGNNTFSNNSAFGHLALRFNGVGGVGGPDNVAVGYNAGALRNNYTNCIFIGSGSDANTDNLTNAVAIGYQASVGANNCMVLGGSGANQLSVGIGLTPNAQLQLPTVHANRKLVLYQTANNDHQVYGLGTAAGIFRFQLDSNSSSSAYTFNAGLTSTTSAELMRLTGGGFLGIGTNAPHAPLQFANTSANKIIVLFENSNNDHQFYGFGINSTTFRFQIDTPSANYVFYAGTSTSTSTELMRLTGDGYLGIGGVSPHAPLQFANTSLNRKIVLYDDNNNDHQFYGFGVGSGIFRFQVDSVGAAHVFYAGISTVTSNELMRIQGNGRVGIGTSSPDQMLSVNSSTPNKISGGTWSAFSDARIKDIVGDYEHGLAEIIQIKTRKFKYNDRSGYPDHEKAKINIGIIAQEIEEIFPECIVEKMERGDIPDMRLYDGTALTYALINAVKELNNEIINLKQQINN